MKDEANIVEQYADSDFGKGIEILIRYYPNFIRLVEGFEQSLSFIIKQEKEMKRRAAIGELGVRVQNFHISDPTARELNREVFSELPGPRGIIVSSLCGSTNQRFAVICKGDFPFPFQTSDQNIELEVKSRMQAIDFYCKKCRKSMRISYALTGDDNAPAMNGIIIKCHTHKCTRVVTLKNFTEGQIKERTDALGKCYL